MHKHIASACSILLILLCPLQPVEASKSKPFTSLQEAEDYLNKHYNMACTYYNQGDWRQAANEFEKVIYFFPNIDISTQATYYLGVCYFGMREYDFSNTAFSKYLTASTVPAYFEDAVHYKFCIAERFRIGKKRHPFHARYLPKLIDATDLALTIYDEIAVALPCHELAIKALYSKAQLLTEKREYRKAIDTYQMLMRRFPNHEIVPTCYFEIANIYCKQSRLEFQNPDILAFAELNAVKFQAEFPGDERIVVLEESISYIKESYANGLCNLGLFYERLGKPNAAAIYYQSSIDEFPDTHIAQFCRSRLSCLGYGITTEKQPNFAPIRSQQEPEASDNLQQEIEMKSDPVPLIKTDL